MNVSETIRKTIEETVGKFGFLDQGKYHNDWNLTFLDGSLMMFSSELVLIGTILALLFVRLFDGDRWFPGHRVALWGSFISLLLAVFQFLEFKVIAENRFEFFSGLLVHDPFTVFLRLFLLLFLVLVIYLTKLSGIPDDQDAPDFYSLLIGSTIGMMLMSSANHLIIIFLGIEMASVPSYVMVGFLKGRRTSSEAALKYVVYGAGAAGVMLYGLSLLAGLLGTASMPEMAARISALLSEDFSLADPTVRTLMLGILMVMVGIAFKLSIFPFHFWCPDAFHGAAAEVAGFLSVASKGAAFALLVRFAFGIVGYDITNPALAKISTFLGISIGAIAAATATFGNLAAYGQTNLKRLLAYSTIAHAGYMLMAVGALFVILGRETNPMNRAAYSLQCIEGLLYYLWVYLFMNLGAFAVVALIRNELFSEELADYAGFGKSAPAYAIALSICLFSLVGIPPMGGFWGKFVVFSSLYQAGSLHPAMWLVLVLGGLNTVFSLFYYVRIMKFLFINNRPEGSRPITVPSWTPEAVFVLSLAGLVLLTGIVADPLTSTARDVARVFIP